MLIRCPTCASGYDLAPEMLCDGRVLRCAHCRDAWVHQAGTAAHDGPEITAEARSSRLQNNAAAASPAKRRPSLRRPTFRLPTVHLPARAAPAVFAAVLLGGGLAAVAAKARVVAAFPPSEAVFATLGLPVNLSGLGLVDLRSTVESGDGSPTLTLEGQIANLRSSPTAVPRLRIAVRDKSRRELYYWTAPAPKAELASGERVVFRSRLSAPPRDGQDVVVSFAEPAPERRHVAEVMPGDR